MFSALASVMANQIENVYGDDLLFLSGSNNIGTSIGNIIFNESNFLDWNRLIKMALVVKLKSSSIDGSTMKPNENSPCLSETNCN